MIKKKKRVLLEDISSEWLQIWTTASLVDTRGNKKYFVILANRSVFPNTVAYRGMKVGTIFML